MHSLYFAVCNLKHGCKAHLAQVSALSPDGRCKAFGADADGYGRGEGVATIMMRPAEGVVEEHRPMALLTGSAVNQDGRSSSLTVGVDPCQNSLWLNADHLRFRIA